jgi:hypothetical protein
MDFPEVAGFKASEMQSFRIGKLKKIFANGFEILTFANPIGM